MSKPVKDKHTHKLKRHIYKTGVAVYFCTLPDCHYKIDTALALGKRSICHTCNEEFIMNEYTVRLARPHCMNCSKQKVRGDNGKNYYIRKSGAGIGSSIAQDNVESLKARLGSVAELPSDTDI